MCLMLYTCLSKLQFFPTPYRRYDLTAGSLIAVMAHINAAIPPAAVPLDMEELKKMGYPQVPHTTRADVAAPLCYTISNLEFVVHSAFFQHSRSGFLKSIECGSARRATNPIPSRIACRHRESEPCPQDSVNMAHTKPFTRTQTSIIGKSGLSPLVITAKTGRLEYRSTEHVLNGGSLG